MTFTSALSVASAGQPPVPTTIERRELRPNDVSIDVSHVGVCHSDIHQAESDWGMGIFPMVPGHEIVGTVAAVGSSVTSYALGDRVGVGCLVDSCGECVYCKQGQEQFCEKGAVQTYNSTGYDDQPTYGGYSQNVVVTEGFVLRIPDGIGSDVAAPLLCAGITTYSPLRHWGAGPGKKVAVVGMGGLGHMGVQIANAFGAEVTVLSQSLSKQEDGKALGAQHYYATSDDETFTTLAGTFDIILNTVSANLPVDKYLSLLRVGGAMVNVGAPSEPDTYSAFSLIGANRSLSGSNIGGIRETQEMLDFCAEHGIASRVETIDAKDVAQAWQRVKDSDVRYRFVIDTSTIPAS